MFTRGLLCRTPFFGCFAAGKICEANAKVRIALCHVSRHLHTVQGKDHAQSVSQHSIISAIVVTLARDSHRRLRAIAEISAHPSVRIATIKDDWLPLAVEARDEQESRQIHHWITSIEGVDVADVIAISHDCEAASFVPSGVEVT